jgi:hypothetical protein
LDPQEYYLIEDSEKAIFQSDYLGDPTDIKPAADPNMSSDVQRLTRLQAIMQRAQTVPGYNHVALEQRFLELLNVEGANQIFPVDQNGQAAIQPPPDQKVEIESTKFQAEQMLKNQELQLQASKLDSDIALQETQALLNLAKAESLGNRDEIEGYKVLIQQLSEARGRLRGINEGRPKPVEKRPGDKANNEVPKELQSKAG